MRQENRPFGILLREKRLGKGFSLRKFADLVGISPTYLSQVEHGKVQRPPTADRVKRMAEILEESPDQWIALAGRISEEFSSIIQREPKELPSLLRAVEGLKPEQIRALTERAKKMKDIGNE